jgi:hypothetical protein
MLSNPSGCQVSPTYGGAEAKRQPRSLLDLFSTGAVIRPA